MSEMDQQYAAIENEIRGNAISTPINDRNFGGFTDTTPGVRFGVTGEGRNLSLGAFIQDYNIEPEDDGNMFNENPAESMITTPVQDHIITTTSHTTAPIQTENIYGASGEGRA